MTLDRAPILVAEDDEDDTFLLRQALARSNIANPVVFVSDGAEAIEFLGGTGRFADDARALPVLLLLDLKMSRRSGFEVLEWVRGQPDIGDLPVVVLTSSRASWEIERAYAMGANSYLVKPGSFEELLDMVRSLGSEWLVTEDPAGPGGVL